MISQVPFDPVGTTFAGDDFATNPEPRCPVVLVLDVSGSMSGEPISQLNEGLRTFQRELQGDELAARRVEVAIVTFGPVRVAADFHTADTFTPPVLSAQGDTPMGAAVRRAMDMVEERKALYRNNGVMSYRPWIFLITDGAPTDDWEQVAADARAGDEARKFAFFPVGIDGADHRTLGRFSGRDALRLRGLEFRHLFVWLSNSMKAVSHSRVGDEVPLVDPTQGPGGWAAV
jgi:uncharacterized protein YegL